MAGGKDKGWWCLCGTHAPGAPRSQSSSALRALVSAHFSELEMLSNMEMGPISCEFGSKQFGARACMCVCACVCDICMYVHIYISREVILNTSSLETK